MIWTARARCLKRLRHPALRDGLGPYLCGKRAGFSVLSVVRKAEGEGEHCLLRTAGQRSCAGEFLRAVDNGALKRYKLLSGGK